MWLPSNLPTFKNSVDTLHLLHLFLKWNREKGAKEWEKYVSVRFHANIRLYVQFSTLLVKVS